MAEKKIPRIRFEGFTEAWEQCKLNDITDVRDGTHDSPKYFAEGHPFITSKNVKNGYLNFNDVQYISDADFDAINCRSKVDVNDILMGMIGTIGNIALVRKTPDFAIKNVALIKDTGLVYPKYIYHFLESSSVENQLINSMDGGTQKFIALNKVRELDVKVPNKKEQLLIGDFLEEIDSSITLHQRKCEKLKMFKKSMLEKMFPKNGEKVPEVRFDGFTDDWEQCELAELGKIVTGSTPSTDNKDYYCENGIPWVTPTDISQNITFKTEKRLTSKGEKAGRVVPQDTVLVTCIASIGKNTMLGTKGSFNQQINGLIPDKKVNYPYFLLTESNLWSAEMKKTAAAATMQIVNKNEFSIIETYIPELEEQIKIGEYFKTIDTSITLHQRKVEKLQMIKKSMLDKMFV